MFAIHQDDPVPILLENGVTRLILAFSGMEQPVRRMQPD
jgi:hypothetical protein